MSEATSQPQTQPLQANKHRSKRNIIIVVVIVIVVVVIFSGNYIGLKDQRGLRSEAGQVVEYTNASSWEISDSTGFPDGMPTAKIIFSTNDDHEDVIDFYKENLTQSGWAFIKEDTFYGGRPTFYFSKGEKRLIISLDSGTIEPPNKYIFEFYNDF